MRILVVEDEIKIANFLKKGLVENGFAVVMAETKEMALSHASDNDYDMILLDVMLPDGSGLDVAKSLRTDSYKGPILMLTALSTTKDKVTGLDAGADDYLVKPFSFDELMARVRALLRRYGASSEATTTVLKYSDLELDLISRKVMRGEEEIQLTVKELALLEYFLRHPERPISRSELIEHVWDMTFDPGSNVVDVYINMLRKKVDAPFAKKLIQTVVGQGYAMREKETH